MDSAGNQRIVVGLFLRTVRIWSLHGQWNRDKGFRTQETVFEDPLHTLRNVVVPFRHPNIIILIRAPPPHGHGKSENTVRMLLPQSTDPVPK